MAAAASTAVETSGIGHARTSSGPAVRNEMSRLVGVQLAELHLDPGGQEVDQGVTVGIPGGHLGRAARGCRKVALADVEQDEDRLLGQEAEAPQVLLLVRIERLVADRVALNEPRLKPLEQGQLAFVRLALRRRPVPAGAAEPLEPAIHHGKVRQDELQVELLQVPPRAHRPGRVRERGVVPCANHV